MQTERGVAEPEDETESDRDVQMRSGQVDSIRIKDRVNDYDPDEHGDYMNDPDEEYVEDEDRLHEYSESPSFNEWETANFPIGTSVVSECSEDRRYELEVHGDTGDSAFIQPSDFAPGGRYESCAPEGEDFTHLRLSAAGAYTSPRAHGKGAYTSPRSSGKGRGAHGTPSQRQQRKSSSPRVMRVKPGWVVLDTGCAKAVAGPLWHQQMQAELNKRHMPCISMRKSGSHQFGTGPALQSVRTWRYHFGINGRNETFEVAEVDADVPGLCGVEDMKKWDVKSNFPDHSMETYGKKMPVETSEDGQPCMSLLDYPDDGTSFPSFYESLLEHPLTNIGTRFCLNSKTLKQTQ